MKSASPAKHVSHAKAVVKAAVNAVVVDQNVVMTHRSLTVANKPRLSITTQLTYVLNALSRQPQQTPQRKASSPLPAKTRRKNALPANAAAVTDMVASAASVVTVPSHRQSKLLTPTPRPLHQCSRSTPKADQRQLKWPAWL